MPAMKLTPNAAMRARDVSRPRAEHLAEAEAAEASAASGSRARTGDAANQARGGNKAKTPHPPTATATATVAAAVGRGRRAGGTAQVPATQARPRVTLRSRRLRNTASEIRSAMITKDLVPLEGLWCMFRGGCGGLDGRVTG